MIALRICRAALLASALLPSLAWAGAGTITTKNAAGSTITFVTVTDGSTNNLAAGVLCDGVAGANCVTVKAASAAAAQTDLALVMRNPDLVTGLADAACATDNGTCTIAQLIKRGNQTLTALNTTAGASVAAGNNNIGNVGQISQYPTTAVPYTATATGTTGATTATLTGASLVTTYICGLSIRANATAAATGNATVTGAITGTLNFTQWTAPNASGLGVTEQIFSPCVPASAANTSIAVVSAAPGTGGVVSVTAWGYKL